MPKRTPTSIAEKAFKRQFKLMNRVGQLGRQGVKGPVEKNEKRILGALTKKKK